MSAALAKTLSVTARQLQKVLIAASVTISVVTVSASAQVIFSDDFDGAGTSCTALAPNWSSSDTNLGDIGTFTSNSGSCSLFTRGGEVDVTSPTFDLSSTTGADLTFWVQQGDDAFSENPDGSAESLVLEYEDATGIWFVLETFDAAAIAPGQITNASVSLPAAALHSALRFRFRQTGGSGGPPANGGLGFDFWHVDDVVLTQTAVPPPPPPTPDLTANSCDDFDDGLLNNWAGTDPIRVGINSDTSNSPSNSLFIRHNVASATSVAIDTSNLTEISIWIQRGSDAFSENPEGGEDLVLEYFNSAGLWVTLQTFAGGGTPGEIFELTFPATADFRHSNFRLRLSLLAGSGSDFDYWHIDDVCLVSANPDLNAVKTVAVVSDTLPSTASPFSLPGSIVSYAITVTNNDAGRVDDGSLSISDMLDPNVTMFVGDLTGTGSPIRFIDGAGADTSGVNLVFGSLGDGLDGVVFRDATNAIITPTAPFDPNVASIELNFSGAMNGNSGGGTPTFTVEFEVRVN
ncbi:MAG: hypothetical protein AAF292_16570 [Pseudomonadota bacterium]